MTITATPTPAQLFGRPSVATSPAPVVRKDRKPVLVEQAPLPTTVPSRDELEQERRELVGSLTKTFVNSIPAGLKKLLKDEVPGTASENERQRRADFFKRVRSDKEAGDKRNERRQSAATHARKAARSQKEAAAKQEELDKSRMAADWVLSSAFLRTVEEQEPLAVANLRAARSSDDTTVMDRLTRFLIPRIRRFEQQANRAADAAHKAGQSSRKRSANKVARAAANRAESARQKAAGGKGSSDKK